MSTRYKIVFEHDIDPDFSWLEQDHLNPSHPSYDPVYESKEAMDAGRPPIDGNWYRDANNHVALSMLVYEMTDDANDWNLVDSLGGIDFLVTSDDWVTGTFYRVEDIPARCIYLRELASDALGEPAI